MKNPFYLLAPSELLLPLVALATVAAVIASQATISGAFSVTQQASRLGYLPRIPVTHTSQKVFLLGILLIIFLVELMFFASNTTKIAAGGWFPIACGLIIFTLLTTWKCGREVLKTRTKPASRCHSRVFASI